MTIQRIAALLAVVLLMAVGQVFFKLAANSLGSTSVSADFLWRLATNPFLIAGGVVYALTTVLWVVVLVEGSLSRSYPFVAVPMILVPLAGVLLFREEVSMGLIFGGALVLAGLAVIAYS